MAATREHRRLYVQTVLDLYRHVPGAKGHLLRCDRQLAAQFHDRGVSLDLIRSAMILAVARRTFRSQNGSPLAPIATLHYFRPVLDEISDEPLVLGYVEYLLQMLASVEPDFCASCKHRLP
jgi:hypothetical protein